MKPALALLEISSIARGIVVVDALTKRAKVELLRSQAVSPGKFLVLFGGPVADVEEAFEKGRATADKLLIDELLLPDAHPALFSLITGQEAPLATDEALLINEYTSVGSALFALDRALKGALVEPKKLQVARGIGGKAYFVLGGTLANVQAAATTAATAGRPEALLASEQIARISPDVRLEHL